MSVQPDPSASSSGQQTGLADPEHDPTASYALDPAYVRSLTGQLRKDVATSRADALSAAPPANTREKLKPVPDKAASGAQ